MPCESIAQVLSYASDPQDGHIVTLRKVKKVSSCVKYPWCPQAFRIWKHTPALIQFDRMFATGAAQAVIRYLQPGLSLATAWV